MVCKMMYRRHALIVTVCFGLSLSFLVSGCARLGAKNNAANEHSTAQEHQALRQELNEGYSLLYASVKSLSQTDKVFYVKLESDRVQRVMGGVSDYAGKFQADLERIAEDYPAISIKLDPLPEIEKRKRASVSKGTLKSLAPVGGKSGAAFERKLLLSASGALNQLMFQCQVMAAEEPERALRTVLRDAQARFAGLYEDVVVLLNEEYFIHNTYEPESR